MEDPTYLVMSRGAGGTKAARQDTQAGTSPGKDRTTSVTKSQSLGKMERTQTRKSVKKQKNGYKSIWRRTSSVLSLQGKKTKTDEEKSKLLVFRKKVVRRKSSVLSKKGKDRWMGRRMRRRSGPVLAKEDDHRKEEEQLDSWTIPGDPPPPSPPPELRNPSIRRRQSTQIRGSILTKRKPVRKSQSVDAGQLVSEEMRGGGEERRWWRERKREEPRRRWSSYLREGSAKEVEGLPRVEVWGRRGRSNNWGRAWTHQWQRREERRLRSQQEEVTIPRPRIIPRYVPSSPTCRDVMSRNSTNIYFTDFSSDEDIKWQPESQGTREDFRRGVEEVHRKGRQGPKQGYNRVEKGPNMESKVASARKAMAGEDRRHDEEWGAPRRGDKNTRRREYSDKRAGQTQGFRENAMDERKEGYMREFRGNAMKEKRGNVERMKEWRGGRKPERRGDTDSGIHSSGSGSSVRGSTGGYYQYYCKCLLPPAPYYPPHHPGSQMQAASSWHNLLLSTLPSSYLAMQPPRRQQAPHRSSSWAPVARMRPPSRRPMPRGGLGASMPDLSSSSEEGEDPRYQREREEEVLEVLPEVRRVRRRSRFEECDSWRSAAIFV